MASASIRVAARQQFDQTARDETMNYQSAFREMVTNIYGKDNVLVVHTSTIEFLDGNVLAAMLLEQILFYAGLKTSNGGSFYKRYKEWKDELYAPISRIRAAVSFLVSRGLIKTRVRRVKIKDKDGNWTGRFGDTAVFYQLQWDEYERQFSDFLRSHAEKKRRNDRNHTNDIGKSQTNIPEITPTGNHNQNFRKLQTKLPEVAHKTSRSCAQNFQKLRTKLPEVAHKTSGSCARDFSIHIPIKQKTTEHKKNLKSFSASYDAEQNRGFSGHLAGEKQREVLSNDNDNGKVDAPPEKLKEVASVSDVDDQGEKSDRKSSNEDIFEDMHKREKKEPTPWDMRAAEEFAKVVSSYRKVNRTSDLRKWADVFRRMREVDKVPKKEIRETIEWYKDHIGEDYIPVAYSADAFRRKFAEGKFAAAMERVRRDSAGQNGKVRITYENQREVPSNLLAGGAILKIEVDKDGRQYDGVLLYKIRKRLRERFGPGRPLPEELKKVLEEDFPDAGDIPLSIIGSVG